jgi:hypothetical protein
MRQCRICDWENPLVIDNARGYAGVMGMWDVRRRGHAAGREWR